MVLARWSWVGKLAIAVFNLLGLLDTLTVVEWDNGKRFEYDNLIQ